LWQGTDLAKVTKKQTLFFLHASTAKGIKKSKISLDDLISIGAMNSSKDAPKHLVNPHSTYAELSKSNRTSHMLGTA